MVHFIPNAKIGGAVVFRIVEIVEISATLYFWVSGTFGVLWLNYVDTSHFNGVLAISRGIYVLKPF